MGNNSSIKVKKWSRKRVYGEEERKVLLELWKISDYICGKRLKPLVPVLIEKAEKFAWIEIKEEVKEKVKKMSAETIDRILKGERDKYRLKRRGRTKPGTLLKKQIRVRTFSEWDEGKAGFLEIDLVSHDGGVTKGDYGWTLNATDVKTGLTSFKAVKNRAQIWVHKALEKIKGKLPFPLLGIDSDNDSAFINGIMLRYCNENKITFTRSRAYRKNDNCYVEQKKYLSSKEGSWVFEV